MNEIALIESYALRQEFCTDQNASVLEKVGHLVLLKGTDFGTMKHVADFYDVPVETIKTIVYRNLDELREDGYKVLKSSELEKFHLETLEIPNRGLAIFPRRAILRIGCLLRDSAVAKLVRSYLLNAEERLGVSPHNQQTLKHLVNQLDQHAVQLIENADELKSYAEQLRSQTRMIKVVVDEIYRNRSHIDRAGLVPTHTDLSVKHFFDPHGFNFFRDEPHFLVNRVSREVVVDDHQFDFFCTPLRKLFHRLDE